MIEIDGENLTVEEVARVAYHAEEVRLSPIAIEKIERARGWVDEILQSDKPVYGINTGFGVFADRRIPENELVRLNRNLMLSHSSGTGPAFRPEVVRAAMLVRVNTLAKGFSGIRLQVVQTLVNMLNRGVTPVIPEQGSLGSSGDLAPLSFTALVLSTDEADREEDSGMAEYQGRVMSGKAAMQAAGIPRLVLLAKEGLAINNGATFGAALAALEIFRGEKLQQVADIAAAMSLEALLGCSSAFDERIQAARGHPGQLISARNIREFIRGSSLVDSTARVQDAYSLRCVPQVHGAIRDTLAFVQETIEREINAATDNPLLFGPGEALSGGNFHGEPVGMAADMLGIAIAELAGISERRIFRLTDGRLNAGLPPMLVDNPQAAGLNSGVMMPQYTAAALVLENRTLAVPDSVNSLPTSAGQEDFNANSMTAARHTQRIIENTQYVLAIELYTAARGLYLRLRQNPKAQPGQGTAAAFHCIQNTSPYIAGDTWWKPHIDRVSDLIRSGELIERVNSAAESR